MSGTYLHSGMYIYILVRARARARVCVFCVHVTGEFLCLFLSFCSMLSCASAASYLEQDSAAPIHKALGRTVSESSERNKRRVVKLPLRLKRCPVTVRAQSF